jgi:hypothetical protein
MSSTVAALAAFLWTIAVTAWLSAEIKLMKPTARKVNLLSKTWTKS